MLRTLAVRRNYYIEVGRAIIIGLNIYYLYAPIRNVIYLNAPRVVAFFTVSGKRPKSI